MKAVRSCCVSLIMLLPLHAYAEMEVVIAPLVVQDETGGEAAGDLKPEADLLEALRRAAEAGGITMRGAGGTAEEAPRSLLEAARLCEQLGSRYLLYGYVKRSESSYSAEVKLLEGETKQVAASFFSSDDRDNYPRLIRDIASKIVGYFYDVVGLKPSKNAAPMRNLISFPISIGYWTPMGGEWDRVVSGLGSIELGMRFIPLRPLVRLGSRGMYMGFGLDVEYDISMNEPSYESFFLHTAKCRLPVEFVFEFPGGSAIGLGVAGLFQFDVLVQDRVYTSSPYTAFSAAGGASFSFLYRYSTPGAVSLGLESVVDIAAYTPVLATFTQKLYIELTPGHSFGEAVNE